MGECPGHRQVQRVRGMPSFPLKGGYNVGVFFTINRRSISHRRPDIALFEILILYSLSLPNKGCFLTADSIPAVDSGPIPLLLVGNLDMMDSYYRYRYPTSSCAVDSIDKITADRTKTAYSLTTKSAFNSSIRCLFFLFYM